jgi:hypothetical protein
MQVDTIHYCGGWRCQNATKLAGAREFNYLFLAYLHRPVQVEGESFFHFLVVLTTLGKKSSRLDIFRCSDTQ